jgi:F0F1-type ATP synthase assembly protein I
MNLSEYADMFGKPNQDIHAYRIGPFASVDLIGTLVIGGLIGYFLIDQSIMGMIAGMLCLILLGIIMHLIFGVKTALNVMLFS